MRSSLRGAGAAAAAIALVLVVAGSWFGYQQLAGPSCSGKIQLSLAAAPEIAPAVEGAADQWVADGAAVGGTCIAVNVTSAESVDVAAAVASKYGATLAGVGQASGTVVTPDIWVPDSASWLLRLKAGGATAFAPANGNSIARSPVVIAMPEPVAARFGWPDKKLGWTDLLRQVTSDKPLRAGIVEPTQDAAALSGLLSLATAASATGGADANKAQEATIGALRALATNRSSLRQDLLARFPRSSDPAAIASGLGAAALSEEDVVAYNNTKPPIPLAALYLDPAPVPLDYPFTLLPGVEPAKASAAKVLFEVLTTPGFKNRLAGQALRAPDGNWGQGFKAPQGAPSPAGGDASAASAGQGAAGGLDPAQIQKATSTWSVATQSGRMLSIIDVSGSMKQKVATANGATREQVTVAAANQGLALFDDSWSIGLWTFSTNLRGSQDYREIVPIKPLSSNRRALQQGLASITPSSGNTGLFDTLLAAYKTVQEDWEPGKVNSIVLFTDGKNDDDNGISQKQLIDQLKKLRDPEQPVQVIIIGIGNDVSKAELDPITAVTGGRTFVTIDPTKIGEIFLQAIAIRPPAPR
ncbi:substrate-binding and VWA domain-containing protein [Micromonospora yasonensis]|uniref:substrate-binding and VWA domain-containing protein n=1 Tax=Micromonospora yasonensis TaxID=1128667 RepID=UPI0022313B4A|nr:substrate-binding and VWA domain-containing protein [Micromonospora yasonensis]MCW3841970.1 substrate-binding and VWA domain-containing protein [Micromonospora yasonensis]